MIPCSVEVRGAAPVDFKGDGWSVSSEGALPRPTVSVDNTRMVLLDMVLSCNDLRGAKVTRWKILSKWLDDGAEPDPEAWLNKDVFYVDQKTSHDKRVMEFELRSPLDLAERQLPARQILRDWCPRRYRYWNAASGAFVYAHADVACPYSGSACWDADGHPASPADDVCAKTRAACLLRFGRSATLPTWAFYGVAANRSS
ncbi:phage minor tail protein L [Desulfovibrio aminophilus]|uniref:phage minor tail protein L n=1 Tax=Desulfovibrio aminophilus TaxID=81425 RepID=UPI00042984B4|nr:phage minor tail protein L [Desulfovibrio aminophilus]